MREQRADGYTVKQVEHCWICLSSGVRLAARLWLPECTLEKQVPAILEYIPYGKREGTRERDEKMHGYFAAHGYAAVRVDVRGSGDSEGILSDEYAEQELADGEEVIDWIAAQPWCDGAVGMIGKSWGGFNALQIAARRPPALRAVVSVCASDDRYADDAHFMGGCLLAENFIWGAMLFGLVAQPPDPQLVGEAWRQMWQQRLEHAEPFAARWLEHPLRDSYWRRGSVCEDFARITCPVYAVGGWADGYSNAVPRLLAGLHAPRRGLIGPWAHVYPHEGIPGPAIGFLQEALRWWDEWLRGRDTGILKEPVYRVWMQDSRAPERFGDESSGRWVAEPSWPSPRIRTRYYTLRRRGLVPGATEDAPDEEPLDLISPQSTGITAGSWCAFGIEGEFPLDQRLDDGRSLVFDSEPLTEPLETLGAACVRLQLVVDQPSAFVCVRLCDVHRDGTSSRVSYGLRNLTHNPDHSALEPPLPGRRLEVEIRLNDAAHSFPVGHRLRVAVSTCYWPLVWPSPQTVGLRLFSGTSSLELPVRPARPEDASLPAFSPAAAASALGIVELDPGGMVRRIERDLATQQVTHLTTQDLRDDGEPAISHLPPIDLHVGYGIRECFTVRDDAPLSATAEIEHRSITRRGEWCARILARTRVSADADEFRIEAELSAFEGKQQVFERDWDIRVPRKGN